MTTTTGTATAMPVYLIAFLRLGLIVFGFLESSAI